jgi:predicted ATPase
LADAKFFRGWLAVQQGQYDGIEPMVHSASLPFFAPFRAFYLIQIVDAQLRAKQFDRAMAMLDRTATEVETESNHFCEPEIYRLRGEVLLAQSRANAAPAEAAWRKALTLATQQCCRVLELRAATSLARFLSEERRRDEAHDLLAPLYATFTEGFDRPDLLAAKALLAELN